MDIQNRELSSDTIDFIRSIEFSDEIKPKTEIKEEGANDTDDMKSETIIRPKLESREILNSSQLEIKTEPTFEFEVKKEIIEEFDVIRDFNNKSSNSKKLNFLINEFSGKTIKIESTDDDPMLKFSKEVIPKIEIKDELIEPKKEVDDELQIGFGVLDTMDDIGFKGGTFDSLKNDSLPPQQNLTTTQGFESSQFDVVTQHKESVFEEKTSKSCKDPDLQPHVKHVEKAHEMEKPSDCDQGNLSRGIYKKNV